MPAVLEVLDKPEEVGVDSTRLARIGSFFQRTYVDTGKLAGAQIVLSRRGQVFYRAELGRRDAEADAPVTPDTIFRIYSMTKPITSVALMMLYEQGLFQLDDPVSKFVPSWADLRVWEDGTSEKYTTAFPDREMIVKDLFTHTSGLTYGFMGRHPVDALYRKHGVERVGAVSIGPRTANTVSEMVDRLAEIPLLFSPGTRWSYSVATDVLGRLIEIISGRSLDEFLSDNLFVPLGMVDTGFHVPAEKAARLAANYAFTPKNPLVPIDPPATSSYLTRPTFFSGGGGLVSTAHDYHRFCQMLLRRGELDGVRVLGRKTVEHMTMNHLPTGGDLASMGQRVFSETTYEGIGFGLGFAVMLDPTRAQVIGSPGEYNWGGAASTMFWVDPSEELVGSLFTQLMPSATYPLRRQLKALTYQSLID